MLCLHFEFLAGHYHATAWGHQVNEATVEWPPSPWRILRALVSGWHRLDRPSTVGVAKSIIGKLASCDPIYDLPAHCEAHTRHYMPTRTSTTLVFDAFLTMSREQRTVHIGFQGVQLTEEEQDLIDRCLAQLGYLGRAESWVEARRGEWVEEGTVVRPGQTPQSQLVPGAMSPDQYTTWSTAARTRIKKKSAKPPPDLWGALNAGTSAAQKGRWSSLPGTRDISYDLTALGRARTSHGSAKLRDRRIRVVRYRLIPEDTVLPLFRDGLLVGEALHKAMAYRCDDVGLPDPSRLVGKRDGVPVRDEGHAYIAWTGEGSGRNLNRVTHVHVALPTVQAKSNGAPATHAFSLEELQVLYAVDHLKIRSSSGTWPRFRLLVEAEWNAEDLVHLPRAPAPIQQARAWRSVSPVVLHRHPKVRGGRYVRDAPEAQLRRYLARAGFPEVVSISPYKDPADWVPFRRRRGRGPGRAGVGAFGFEIHFAEDVRGPIAVGALAHFGLGRFEPLP